MTRVLSRDGPRRHRRADRRRRRRRRRATARSAAASTCAGVAPASSAAPASSDVGPPLLDRDLPDRLKSVVYLETAPRGAFEQTEPARAVMDQRNETFVPHVLAITDRHDRRLPEQRSHLPQRVLAVEDQELRPRPLRGRPLEVHPLRSAGHRAGVLRHPLAHERVHPGLQPSVLRDDRRRGTLPDRRRAAGRLHAWSPGTKALASDPKRRDRRRRRRRPSSISRCDDACSPRCAAASSSSSALLAVLSIGVAIYLVSVRVTRGARGVAAARNRRDRQARRPAAHHARADLHDDGAAHRRRAEAEGRGRHRRSADRAGHRERLPEPAELEPAARHQQGRQRPRHRRRVAAGRRWSWPASRRCATRSPGARA